MSDFLDFLFDPQATGKKGREKIAYREKLRAHILDAPPLRRLPLEEAPRLMKAVPATLPLLPEADAVVAALGRDRPPEFFREWKKQESHRPIWRLDGLSSEEQVLEARAMGVDAYTIRVAGHDEAMIQFLVEVGRDYGLPAILRCDSAEDLAQALRIQDVGVLWLRAELAEAALLSWDGIKGRLLLWESAEAPETPTELQNFILHISEVQDLDAKENTP